jgi:hypothetical protein
MGAFGGTAAAGAARITANGNSDPTYDIFVAASKTYTTDASGGTAGTFSAQVSPIGYYGFVGYGSTKRVALFAGLPAIPGTYRANVTFYCGLASKATLTLSDKLGAVLATATMDLPADTWIQKTAQDWFGVSQVPEDAQLKVEVTAGGLTGYISVIDNNSNDAVVRSLFHNPN